MWFGQANDRSDLSVNVAMPFCDFRSAARDA
jgi:hypothetical protein